MIEFAMRELASAAMHWLMRWEAVSQTLLRTATQEL